MRSPKYGVRNALGINWSTKTHLGNLEEGFGNVNNTSHLLDVLNALLDGLGVVGTGRVQDAADLLDLSVGPLSVHWSGILSNSEEDGKKGESDNGLLVDDVVLVGESVDSGSGGGGEDGGLGDEGVAWEGIEDGLGLLLWLLSWNRGLVSGQCRDSADWSSWTDAGRAYTTVSPRTQLSCCWECARRSTYRGRSLPNGMPL